MHDYEHQPGPGRDDLTGPLRDALSAAGYASLSDLARSIGYTAQFLQAARCGACGSARPSPRRSAARSASPRTLSLAF